MHGFSVYVVYNISYLQVVILGILISSKKMGRKNRMSMRTRHPVMLKFTILKFCHEDFPP